MAGSSSNWFKVSAGPLKGKTVYLTKQQQGGLSRPETLGLLNGGMKALTKQANTAMPKGVAQKAGAVQSAPAKPKPAQSVEPTQSAQRREFDTPSQAITYTQQHYQKWGDNLTPNQESALVNYQNDGYYSLNKALRAGRPLDDSDKELAQDLTAAIKRAPGLPDAISVHRGMHAATPEAKATLDSWEPGGVYKDSAFLSTTVDERNMDAYKNSTSGVTMEFRLPKGHKGAYLQVVPSRIPGYEYEQELLLGRNTRYRVLSKTERPNGSVHVVMEVI